MPITILIVDDEVIVRRLVRVAIKDAVDALFLEASNAPEALKVAREHRGPIDILLSDVAMPGRMNGIEMAGQLCQSRPEIKVFVMSGYAPEALAMKPDWRFIQKPFGVSEIRERIAVFVAENFLAAR